MASDDELRAKGREVMAKLWGERAGKGAAARRARRSRPSSSIW